MPRVTRFWSTLAGLGLVAAVAMGGLTACGGGPGAAERGAAADQPRPAPLTAEEEALGLEAGYLLGEDAESTDRKRGHKRHRHIAKRLLHGELVVATERGHRTVLVQRGEIVAVDDDSMTVKSADGYTLTWSFAEKLRVFEHRDRVGRDALAAGETVAVAGGPSGDAGVARLILLERG